MMRHLFRTYALTLCLFSILYTPSVAKGPVSLPSHDPDQSELEIFAENKTIPDEIREAILTALSHYPELQHTNIEFAFRDDIRKSVMQAQPRLGSFFKRKSKREYVVKISKYLKLRYNQKANIETLPFEVLVGWIAHELGHIMDYKDRSSLGMLGFGLKYVVSKNFLLSAERRADVYALKHGLGNSIIATKNFVLNHADIPLAYKQRIKRFYMSPEEFLMLLGEAEPVPVD